MPPLGSLHTDPAETWPVLLSTWYRGDGAPFMDFAEGAAQGHRRVPQISMESWPTKAVGEGTAGQTHSSIFIFHLNFCLYRPIGKANSVSPEGTFVPMNQARGYFATLVFP